MFPQPYIGPFSTGYDLAEMVVSPRDISSPQINTGLHEDLQYREETADTVEPPIIFKQSNGTDRHFEVDPSPSVPIDAIEMPTDMVADFEIEDRPYETEFLVARPEHALELKRMGIVQHE